MLTGQHLQSLNKQQLEAVNNLEGPLLVLAGAGTGKTKVLTTRIANIIINQKAYPSQILAVTFTNKAAKQMRERVTELVNTDGLWSGTFHSIAAKILRQHANVVGLNYDYNIIDSDDQLRLIKNIIISLDLDEKQYPAKAILPIIQRWKDLALTVSKISDADTNSTICNIAYRVYIEYQKKLNAIGAVDFGDLLLYNIEIFGNNREILTYYQNKFKYILVDEYQDTNIAQYIWLRFLAQKYKNICCVGDEDQSIYGWRGAEIDNILRFEKDFPGAQVVRLEQNYRSSNHILAVASNLISYNKKRLGKVLWTDLAEGGKVKLANLQDDRDEARFVATRIILLRNNDNILLKNVAILVRAGFQTRSFEECFLSYGLNYKVVGGFKFYERAEIKDVIAYIRVAIRQDDDLALERIINTPKRSIGDATINQIRKYAVTNNLSLFKSIQAMITESIFKNRIAIILQTLVDLFIKWHAMFDIRHHIEVVENILQESGYLQMWKNDKSLEAEARIDNIKELLRALSEFNNITEFLEHITLVTDTDTTDIENTISIMTLHAAKGLEFDYVFLPGWENGIFPNQRSIDENGNNGLEEERRLAYVGITRARKDLYISHANYRRIYNQFQTQTPSKFIAELPIENIEEI